MSNLILPQQFAEEVKARDEVAAELEPVVNNVSEPTYNQRVAGMLTAIAEYVLAADRNVRIRFTEIDMHFPDGTAFRARGNIERVGGMLAYRSTVEMLDRLKADDPKTDHLRKQLTATRDELERLGYKNADSVRR